MSKYQIGAFITDLALLLTNTGLTITVEVMQANLKQLYDKYQYEIDLIGKIKDLLEKISFHKQVFLQVQSSQRASLSNWNTIYQQLKKNLEIATSTAELVQKNQLERPPDKPWYQYLALGTSQLLGYAFCLIYGIKNINELRKNLKAQAAVKKMIKQSRIYNLADTESRIGKSRTLDFQVLPSEQRSKKLIARQVSFDLDQTLQSGVSKISGWQKFQAKALWVMRGISVILSIFSIYKLSTNINDLKQQYNKAYLFFTSEKQIKQIDQKGNEISKKPYIMLIEELIDKVKIICHDIVNLSKGSRAVIDDAYYLYMNKALVQIKNYQTYLYFAQKLKSEDYGLTDNFLKDIQKLTDKALQAQLIDVTKQYPDQNGQLRSGRQHKLQQFRKALNYVITDKDINKIFLQVGLKLSALNQQTSIFIKTQYQYDMRQKQFILELIDRFSEQRPEKQEQFQKLPLQQKKIIDNRIFKQLKRSFIKFYLKQKYPEYILDKNQQKQLAFMIAQRTDKFYATDDAGETIFGLDIKTIREQSKSFQKIIKEMKQKKTQSVQQFIPSYYKDQKLQLQKYNKLRQQAIKAVQKETNLNLKQQFNQLQVGKLPKGYFRYNHFVMKNSKGQIISMNNKNQTPDLILTYYQGFSFEGKDQENKQRAFKFEINQHNNQTIVGTYKPQTKS